MTTTNTQHTPSPDKQITIKQLKEGAKILVDGYNTEYERGICELIADFDGIPDLDHAERANEIALELGLNKDLYSFQKTASAPELKAENERLNTLVQSQKDDIDNLQEFTVKIEAFNAELLEALKMLYTAFPKHGAFENDQVKACIYAKAAIAKAEGKG